MFVWLKPGCIAFHQDEFFLFYFSFFLISTPARMRWRVNNDNNCRRMGERIITAILSIQPVKPAILTAFFYRHLSVALLNPKLPKRPKLLYLIFFLPVRPRSMDFARSFVALSLWLVLYYFIVLQWLIRSKRNITNRAINGMEKRTEGVGSWKDDMSSD